MKESGIQKTTTCPVKRALKKKKTLGVYQREGCPGKGSDAKERNYSSSCLEAD